MEAGTASPGATYVAQGGIAFKTFTSTYVVASIGNGHHSSFVSNTAAAASAGIGDKGTAAGAAKAAGFGPGVFSYTPGSASAASIRQGSLKAFGTASLTECLTSCTYQSMCSGVMFGPYNETTDALQDIAGAAAGTKCQWIMGQSRPGDSRRTLIKTRDPVSLPS